MYAQENGAAMVFSSGGLSGLFSPINFKVDPFGSSSYSLGRPPLPTPSVRADRDMSSSRSKNLPSWADIRSTSPNSMSIADALYQLKCVRNDDHNSSSESSRQSVDSVEDALTVS
jgi:hypothetical protein